MVSISTVAGASEENIALFPDLTGTLWILVALFVALIFPTNTLLFKPILRVLDEREERTVGTWRRAEGIQQDAERTLAEYEQAVRQVREEAERERKRRVAEARAENAKLTAGARSEAEGEIDRARSELAAALDESRRAMRTEVESLATDAAAQVLGRPL